ncbi:MFS transporter [Alkalitalea saponilacus]|uniref:MFS transporter, OFA family, oxalate/formate antiporter n=1 Tax=Alkalitalea saponilacus TaxID=889453 RepID=A0A1T5HTV5_9BACT|nr:MFS transporter [Alkalitalea saponilacus]ASB50236.1 MFS transporter [Alkalitalea saponilacus]SKC24117.1 MFS transporter, OFA family, oxalate/formate antiporter [Alkalitalea saponilacus]
MKTETMEFNEPTPNKPIDRRLIIIFGVILLLSLGSVYAWSFFTKPLMDTYHWSAMQVSAVFSLAVAGLGFSALYTGPLVSKLGSRFLMRRSSFFFVSGYIVAAIGLYLGSGIIGSIETPWVNWLSFIVLALGYGVIGGIGLGTGYVTAVSTVAGWFPDKKGFATGVIVMGFGLGALFMSKVFAPIAMKITSNNIALTFLVIAAVYAVIMAISCKYIYSPHSANNNNKVPTVGESYVHTNTTRVRLWLLCFLYSLAGLGIISLMSPLMQSVLRVDNPSLSTIELAAAGATLIAAASIGNSVGRLFWAWLSDIVGRIPAFVVLLTTSASAFIVLPYIASPLIFGILVSYTIASYGGAFGTIPSLISDLFGPKRMSSVHGLVLSGWATAGLSAPPLFGYMYDVFPEYAAVFAFYVCAGALLLATVIVLSLKGLHVRCSNQV